MPLSSEDHQPPILDMETVPVSGDLKTMHARAPAGKIVPLSGELPKIITFSGEKGSICGRTISHRSREAIPSPPRKFRCRSSRRGSTSTFALFKSTLIIFCFFAFCISPPGKSNCALFNFIGAHDKIIVLQLDSIFTCVCFHRSCSSKRTDCCNTINRPGVPGFYAPFKNAPHNKKLYQSLHELIEVYLNSLQIIIETFPTMGNLHFYFNTIPLSLGVCPVFSCCRSMGGRSCRDCIA